MATCKKCGAKIGMFGGSDGLCSNCREEERQRLKEEEERARAEQRERERVEKQKQAEKERARRKALESIVLTTEVASNLDISERVDIIIAHTDCSFDVKLQENKKELMDDLRQQAYDVDANAVVGVTFNIEESYAANIGAGNIKKFKLIAYGTAVRVEPEEVEAPTTGPWSD